MSTKALAKSSILQISGRILGVFFGLATFYLLLQIFDTDGYGVFTTALTYVTLFSVIVDFGLTITTAQMISEDGADEQKILGNLFSLRILSALVFMSLAPISALFIPGADKVFPLICIASVTYFFGAVAQMLVGVFQKRLSLMVPVLAEMLSRLIALGGIALIGLWHGSLLHATAAFTVGAFVQFIIMLVAAQRLTTFRPQFELRLWKEIVRRSSPIGFSIFFNLLYLKGDILFMWFLGQSDEVIGQYGSAYKVMDVLTMVPVTFMGLMLPIMSKAWSAGDKTGFAKRLQQTFDVFCVLAIPFAFGAWVLGVPLMQAVKPDLGFAGALLWVLVPAAVAVFFGSLYGHVIVAVQQQKTMMKNYLIVAVIGLAAYYVLISRYGAWGAAWTTLLCESIIAILAFVIVTRTIKFAPQLSLLWKALGASAVMAAVVLILAFALDDLGARVMVPIAVVIGASVYFATLGLLGGPNVRDVRKIFGSDAI